MLKVLLVLLVSTASVGASLDDRGGDEERRRSGESCLPCRKRVLAALPVGTPVSESDDLACGKQEVEGKQIKVTVVVIAASGESGKVDRRLRHIAAEVRKKQPKLKSFRIASMHCQSVKIDEAVQFELLKKKFVEVVVKKAADARKRVRLSVKPPDQGKIVYRTVCEKFLPIVTRTYNEKKERLILAIRVAPCKDK